ncbi:MULTISPECIES: fimbrial protein [Lelliottia]|nr:MULTISPECIES: fimbrial protein [Lelliottia]
MKYYKAVPKSTLLLFLMVSFTSGTALAVNSSNVQITVNGTVAGSSCTVVGGSSQTVDLGVASPAILNSSNSAWVWKAFTIGLEHCPIGMTNATITFSGEPDPDNALYYKNTAVASEGTTVADHVAIQLAPQVGNEQLSTGSQMVTTVNRTSHQAIFNVQARMITPTGRATAGAVAGHIDYTVEYK